MAEGGGGWPVFTAAAVQAAPVYLDRDATIDKAWALISKAGRAGARLIAFPEAFASGFPHWIYLDQPQANERYFVDLVRRLPQRYETFGDLTPYRGRRNAGPATAMIRTRGGRR